MPARCWLLLTLLIMVLVYGTSILTQQTKLIDGRRVFWLHDDMMISMRYGQNLARGDGLVWNPGGERVEGYSNFGWVLVMATVHLFPIPDTLTSLVMLLINVALAGLVLYLTMRLVQILMPQATLAIPITLLTIVVIYDFGRWTLIGLETILLTALFLWLLLRVLGEAEAGRPQPQTFFLAGVLGIVRVDGVALAGLLCLLAFMLNPARRHVFAYSGLVLILPVAHVIFRLAYYGAPLPNTYYLKVTGWNRTTAGLRYSWRFLSHYGVVWALALVGAWLSGDRRAWVLCLLGVPLLLYGIYVGGDDFGGSRFLAPWIPVLLTLGFLSLRWLGWHERPLRHVLALAALPALLFILQPYNYWGKPTHEGELLQAGLVVRDTTPTETTLAHFWAGTLPYYADRPAIDLLGKNDVRLARQPAQPSAMHPGHNKFDYDYSVAQLRPDVVVGYPPSMVAEPEALSALAQGNWSYVGQLFLHPTFQSDYAPSLALIGPVALYIRADSPARTALMQGTCRRIVDADLTALGLREVCIWD